MSYKNLLYEITDNTAVITLNRPEKMNSLDEQLIKDITGLFTELASNEDIKVVILTGSNNNFCSGLYLDYLQKISEYSIEENRNDSRMFRDMLLSIYNCPKPVIAKVSGYALAGGCGIATCCDFIIADETAKFGYTEVKIGFIPAIVSAFLLERVSATHAKDLLLTSRLISAEEAFNIDLINKVVSLASLDEEVNKLRDLLLKNPPGSMERTKMLLRKIKDLKLEDALDYACDLNAETRMTDECRNGVSGFLNRSRK
jgi:methylglutaconyl-CoA hydratase